MLFAGCGALNKLRGIRLAEASHGTARAGSRHLPFAYVEFMSFRRSPYFRIIILFYRLYLSVMRLAPKKNDAVIRQVTVETMVRRELSAVSLQYSVATGISSVI